MVLCLSCPESIVRNSTSVVCVCWHGVSVAPNGSRPYDLGLFPWINHALGHGS